MPRHFFGNALELLHSTAIPADVSKQDYGGTPRYWFLDARFPCDACSDEFLWPAREQKVWFETYRFFVDAFPKQCRDCRARRRNAEKLRKDYDALVGRARTGGTAEQKREIVRILDELEASQHGLSDRMRETRDLFRRQLSKEESG